MQYADRRPAAPPRVSRVVVGFTCGELTVAAWAAGREHQGLLVLDCGCVERQSAPEAAQRSARRVSALRSPRAGSRRLGRYRRVSAENADLRLQFLVFVAGEGEIPLHRVGIVGSQRSRSPLSVRRVSFARTPECASNTPSCVSRL